jgi:PEP-CTERM motif-containing protein
LTAINRVLDDVSGNSATFTAEAGQIYTIYLGGFMGGNWTDTRNDYQLTISTSTVPVPGAIWLFGSALAGFMGVKRRKQLSA